MINNKDNVYVGNKDKGNPYEGDLERGIDYDTYEANFIIVEQNGNFPLITHPYKINAKRLVKHLSLKEEQKILDIGSGTGISTLELFLANSNIHIIGVEISEGMFLTARYKFNQTNGEELIERIKDENLLRYWEEFRKTSKPYKDKVEFIKADFQEVELESRSINNAIANQVLHWKDLSKSFKQLNKFLKHDGELIWSTSSHFYNDRDFPSLEFGFRCNDFVKYVLDEVNKSVSIIGNYLEISRPKHNLDSLRKIALEQGFGVEQIATYLIPVDLQIFVKNHLPAIIRQLVDPKYDPSSLEIIIKEAIAKNINDPKTLGDIKHKYDINPIFRSFKL